MQANANKAIPRTRTSIVCLHDQRLLMIELEDPSTKKRMWSLPGGKIEELETPGQAAIRETLEETAWLVELESALRVTLFTAPGNGVTYLRTTFVAKALSHDSNQSLDSDIEEALWLSYDDIIRLKDQLRSPVVLSDIEYYRAGHRIALEAFTQYPAPDAIAT